MSFKVDNKLPNLVNLNEDPQLSEMLLYVLKEGMQTLVDHVHVHVYINTCPVCLKNSTCTCISIKCTCTCM